MAKKFFVLQNFTAIGLVYGFLSLIYLNVRIASVVYSSLG